MTAKAALCEALLKGRVLNIKNCFSDFGITNCPREIGRMIERPFDVKVTRIQRNGRSRFGSAVSWVDYKLEKTEKNTPGIEAMKQYVADEKNKTKGGVLDEAVNKPIFPFYQEQLLFRE